MAAFHYVCLAAFILDIPLSWSLESLEGEDNSRYKSIEANSTLLNLLLDPDRDQSLRSEVFDMLHSWSGDSAAPGPAFPEDSPTPPPPPRAAGALVEPSMQAELVQGAEAVVQKDSARLTQRRAEAGARGALMRGAMSGIMVGLTCAIVFVAYLALVLYKRHEMIRNGKHERLRTEEPTTETTETVDV